MNTDSQRRIMVPSENIHTSALSSLFSPVWCGEKLGVISGLDLPREEGGGGGRGEYSVPAVAVAVLPVRGLSLEVCGVPRAATQHTCQRPHLSPSHFVTMSSLSNKSSSLSVCYVLIHDHFRHQIVCNGHTFGSSCNHLTIMHFCL